MAILDVNLKSGETSEIACLRELAEETGLRGKIKRLIGVYTQKSDTMARLLLSVMRLVFLKTLYY